MTVSHCHWLYRLRRPIWYILF